MLGRSALAVVRLAGLTALLLIVGILSGWPLPLHAHMAAGGLAVLGLWGLALTGWRRGRGLSCLGFGLGLLVPVLGVAQIHWPMGDWHGVIPILHGGMALAALMVAEFLGRRLKAVPAEGRIHEFTVTDISGKDHSLAQYRDKVLLIVNTASKCGFTPQYGELEALFQDYSPSGLVILGFPCNQFGGQEPGNADEIITFCQRTYEVSFPILAKVDVNGPEAEPLFVWLKEHVPGVFGSRAIKWNFTKFLVDRQGRPVARFAPSTRPEALRDQIEQLL